MAFRIDIKDRKILSSLDRNSRMPLSQIAKETGLSKEGVHYRIGQLEKYKIITGYVLFVDLSRLGLTYIKTLIKLQNIKKEKKEVILEYLAAHNNSGWVAMCRGSYDLIASFVVKDLLEFRKIKDEMYRLYSAYIHSMNFSIMLGSGIYGRKYLFQMPFCAKNFEISQRYPILEEIDFRILKMLSKNTRINVTEIGRLLNITPRIVSYRIGRMENSGIIQKYSISLNHSLLGISFFKAMITLSNIKQRTRLLSYLAGHKNCTYNMEALGTWDLEPEFEVFSTEEYYNLLDEIESNFGDIIKNINTVLISKEYKSVQIPEKISGRFYDSGAK